MRKPAPSTTLHSIGILRNSDAAVRFDAGQNALMRIYYQRAHRTAVLVCITAHLLIPRHFVAQEQKTAPPAPKFEIVEPKTSPALSTRELATRVRKSLVLILTQDRAGNAIAQGSGFFFKQNLVATNIHVLKRASQGSVKSIFDGVSYRISSVVGFDLKHDVCVLKLTGVAGMPLPLSGDEVAQGDDILVAGNPEGLEDSFSRGIVSGIRSGSDLIQIDAAISPGSSGGPVVNYHGDVVGLAVSSLTEGQNLNFAVPVRYLREQKLTWDLSLRTVGGLAVTDLEEAGFHGHVKNFIERRARYEFNHDRHTYVDGVAVAQTASGYDQEGRQTEITFFKDGAENGKEIWEYSDDGLIKRSISVDAHGQPETHEYSIDDAVSAQAMKANFDGTIEIGLKSDPYYQEYTYDSSGHLIEKTFPNQKSKYVLQYDARGREIENQEYLNGKLESATRSTYEENRHGDWIKKHETCWFAEIPDSGFVPWAEYSREITYWGED
jgi:hypothetical protein